MNIFRLTVIKFCIVFFIPLKVYSQSTEIYTDLRGNKYAAINDKGMVKYKVEDQSKKMKTVMMSLYTERHGIQRGKKKEDVTGRCPVTFSFHLIL